MVITILIFIGLLAVLVLVHEFGHFIAAKKSGMVVEEFGFGFPPRLVGIRKVSGRLKFIFGHPKNQNNNGVNQTGQAPVNSTIYSVNLIPLGGFVRIMGENNEQGDDPRSFINRPFWGRFVTLIAGVSMNVLLAWILTSGGFLLGLPAAVESNADIPKGAIFTNPQLTIIELQEGFPAQQAGIKAGDAVVSIDGKSFFSVDEMRGYIRSSPGKEFEFLLKRQNQILGVKVKSKSQLKEGEGPTGIVLASVGRLKMPTHLALWQGAKTTGTNIKNIFSGLYHVATSGLGLKALGGPVKIAKLTGEVADMGFVYLLQFASFLSLNLAVLNIMPFPALDGGRVLFLIVEKLRGKKNNQRLEQYANAAGFAFLLLLMVLVTIKDVRGI